MASARRWAGAWRATSAPTPSSCRRGCRPTRRRARRCSRCSRTRRRWSRGSRSTRPSSTSAGCGGCPGTPTEIAARLRREVLERGRPAITVGVARTKFLAKVASAVAKPDGLLVVQPDEELAFLHPLPVERLWGVGPKTAAKLHDRGLHLVGEVAALAESTLVAMLGPASGRHLHALAHNRDPRPRADRARRGSIGSQRAIGWAPHTRHEVEAALAGLVDRVDPTHAQGRSRRPHGRAALAVHRLLAGDAVAHARAGRRRTPSTILATAASSWPRRCR